MNKYDVETGSLAVRKYVDASGYGNFVSQEHCDAMAAAVIKAVDINRKVHEVK